MTQQRDELVHQLMLLIDAKIDNGNGDIMEARFAALAVLDSGLVVPASEIANAVLRAAARGTYPAAMRELRGLIEKGQP